MTISERARPATASDVAALAGVSRATVSHVFNGRDSKFPEETRARVRAAAQSLDYRPSPAGRSLVTGRSDTVVLVMPSTTLAPNVQAAMERITDAAKSSANVVLRFADADPEKTVSAILKLRPLAVVNLGAIVGRQLDRLAAQGVPCAPDPRRPATVDGMPLHEAIAHLQVAELLKHGPRQIVYAAYSDGRSDPYGRSRFAGLERACAARGAATPQRIDVAPDIDAAVAALGQISSFPVGIAAYNDVVGLALLSAGARAGLSIPEQLSVVGLDNTEVGRLWIPKLTTIDVDILVVVDQALKQLDQELISQGAPPLSSHQSDPERSILTLVTGEST